MLSSSIVSWVMDGGIALWGLLTTFVCSCLSAISRSYKENSMFNWLRKLVDVFALNIFHAEPAGSASYERVREGDLGLLRKAKNDFRAVRELYEREKEKVINALSVKKQLQKLVEDKDKRLHVLLNDLEKSKTLVETGETLREALEEDKAKLEAEVKKLKSHRSQLLKAYPDLVQKAVFAEKFGIKVRKPKAKSKISLEARAQAVQAQETQEAQEKASQAPARAVQAQEARKGPEAEPRESQRRSGPGAGGLK